MNDFVRSQGPAFLAHLLRRLADELVRGAEAWYPEAGVRAPPRTISTLLLLDQHGLMRVTEIALRLRQSHPLVITWLRELERLDLTCTRSDAEDGRRTLVSLSAGGRAEVKRIRVALRTMETASSALLEVAGPGTFDGLWRMESACRAVPFENRLKESAKSGPEEKSGSEDSRSTRMEVNRHQ